MNDLTPAGNPLPALPLEHHGGSNPACCYLAGLKSENSKRNMRVALNQVATILSQGEIRECEYFPWHLVRIQHCRWLLTQLQSYKPSSANAKISALRGVLKSCYELDQIDIEDYSKCLLIERVSNQSIPKGRALDREEAKKIVNFCADLDTNAGYRDAALLCIGLGSGLRRDEIAALSLENYNHADGSILIRNGKGGKDRWTYIANGYKAHLDKWLEIRGNEPGPLFLAIDKADSIQAKGISNDAIYLIMKKRAKQTMTVDFSPHDLRRTFITAVIEKGGIEVAGKLAGHQNYDTTKRYDKSDQKIMAQAVQSLDL